MAPRALACGSSTGWWPTTTRAEATARFALFHSPFVGPACWSPVAAWLELLGETAVAADYGGLRDGDTYPAIAGRVANCLPGAGWTVVAHSGAGGLAQAISAALEGPAGVVFVDAILPHPGRSWMDTAPRPLAQRLRDLSPDGVLPPWNLWFPSDPLPNLLGNGEQRAAFAAELPFTPLGFLDQPAPAAPPSEAPGAYLQLSAAYAAESVLAEARGWPVERLDLHHLAMLTHPEDVARALSDLIRRMDASVRPL